ncbi:MAG: hypothetical protein AUG51_12750 [Acidobacteria bacterium 13_1_20CM_3_53_8]|nr:MAG: hypothetical protein AUG51_12750 [Acidobacteria bacterium 13_1_20CM_3_53_8]
MEQEAKLKQRRIKHTERGYTALQLIVVIAITLIVTSFAFMGLQNAKANMRLQNSIRQLSDYMEKARLNAIKRHSTSTITFTSTTSYNITTDFDGSGTATTRSFNFDDGIVLISTPLPTITFDWRGRTQTCTITFAVQNTQGDQSWIDVSGSGDVTINSDVDVLPPVSYSTVSSSTDIASGTTVTGTGVHNNSLTCSDPTAGTGGAPPPPITGTGTSSCGNITAGVSGLSIKKNGGTTGTVQITVTSAGKITTTGPSNLSISPSTKTMSAAGNTSFNITSLNSTRSTFPVTFTLACTSGSASATISVKVTN